jgi:hypothetical protein
MNASGDETRTGFVAIRSCRGLIPRAVVFLSHARYEWLTDHHPEK